MPIGIAILCALPVMPAAAAPPTCAGKRATIVGTDGRDHLVGTPGPDVIVAGSGNDTLEGRGGNDTMCGGKGGDRLNGGRGDDSENGGEGPDEWYLAFDPGDDLINGGSGRDYINFNSDADLWDEESKATGSAYVNLSEGKARLRGAGKDRLKIGTIEAVEGTGDDDFIVGDDRDNWLSTGRYGGGVAYGLGGDDVLVDGQDGQAKLGGGAGNDLFSVMDFGGDVRGGEGTDSITFCGVGTTGADVTIDLSVQSAEATYAGETHVWTLESIEGGTGCRGNDTLIGDEASNVLAGLGGDDAISGMGGDDDLNGGDGVDSLDGGDGVDACRNGEEVTDCES